MLMKKKLLILAGALLLMVAGGYLAIRALLPATPNEVQAEPEPEKIGQLYMVDGVMLNPAGTKGARFLRVSAALETMDGLLLGELEQRDVQIRDIMITELGAHTIRELMDPVSKEEIRQSIIAKINSLLKRGRLTNLYYLDYIVQ